MAKLLFSHAYSQLVAFLHSGTADTAPNQLTPMFLSSQICREFPIEHHRNFSPTSTRSRGQPSFTRHTQNEPQQDSLSATVVPSDGVLVRRAGGDADSAVAEGLFDGCGGLLGHPLAPSILNLPCLQELQIFGCRMSISVT